jgi:TfoX/Sxy family transcriptional regulator of competence genes
VSFPKATEQDRTRFRSLAPDAAEVIIRPMFGNVAAFVGGHMFMGSFGGDIGVKLAGAEYARLAGLPGTGPFGPADRPMAGYVALPTQWGPAEAEPWVALALAQAAALPPKTPKGHQRRGSADVEPKRRPKA